MDSSNPKKQKSQRPRVTLKKNTNMKNVKTAIQSTTSIDEKFDILINKIDEKFSKIDEKFDILVNKIDNLDAKLTDVSNKVDTLESQFKGYVKHEADIQESTVTEYMRQTLLNYFKTSKVQKHSLQYFFLPSSDDQFTDIDGCLIQTMDGHTYTNINGKLRSNEINHAIIIEAKHSLTKSLVNYKIQQFCTIKQTIEDIKTNKIPEEIQSRSFKSMIAMRSLKYFPDTMYFFFATDDLSAEVKEYIYKISTMTLTKEEYDSVIFEDTKDQYNKILLFLNKDVKDNLFKLDKTVDNYFKFFRELDTSLYPKYQQKMISTLVKALIPFDITQVCFKQVKNTLGVVQFGKIYQFEEGKDIDNTSLFGYDIKQGSNLWNFT